MKVDPVHGYYISLMQPGTNNEDVVVGEVVILSSSFVPHKLVGSLLKSRYDYNDDEIIAGFKTHNTNPITGNVQWTFEMSSGRMVYFGTIRPIPIFAG